MLKTEEEKIIEQKLESIKKINEEKDKVDRAIENLDAVSSKSLSCIQFQLPEFHLPSFDVPDVVVRECIGIISNYLHGRRAELIEKASQLMR
jgi:hypothetical protein